MTIRWSHRTSTAGGPLFRILACTLLISGLVFFAPASSMARTSAAAFVDSGTVTLATGGGVADLDPASIVTAAANVAITANTDETLVTYKGASVDQFVPLLAVSWQTNADKSVWTFHLRHNVSFHTGRCCMTADDVKYNIARTILAGLAGSYIFGRYMTNPEKQIVVVDPYTVRFDLGKPQYTFINALASKNAGLILDSAAVKAHATKADPWAHNWVTDHDAGTGPYVLQSWQHNVQETLIRFPAYWDGWSGRHFSKVSMQEIPETATRREMLERGTADITFALTPQDDTALQKESAVKVVAPYAAEIDYIAMTESGPLASPLARQALSYAFDYNADLQAAYQGFAHRGYGPLASILKGYDPNMFHYTTNLDKARTLLQQAGVKQGTTLTYMYVTGYPTERLAGQILQAQLQQLGITVTLQGVTQATQGSVYFGSSPASARPNLMAYAWWPDYNDPWDEAVVMVDSASAGSAGANIGFYHNKQVDALLTRMKTDAPAALVRDAHTLQNITSQVDPPAIWTAEPAQVTILSHTLQGYAPNPLDIQVFSFYPMYRS
jgi:peptide/nickel transport system substrate-binding protein